jgi:hypothetical protein
MPLAAWMRLSAQALVFFVVDLGTRPIRRRMLKLPGHIRTDGTSEGFLRDAGFDAWSWTEDAAGAKAMMACGFLGRGVRE